MSLFSHDAYGCVKYIFVPSACASSLCLANSVPLSVVMDLMYPIYGCSSLYATLSSPSASFPFGSRAMMNYPWLRSTCVSMASLFPGPTMVSISQSPYLVPSAEVGRSSMLTLSLLGICLPTGRLRCLRRWRQFL